MLLQWNGNWIVVLEYFRTFHFSESNGRRRTAEVKEAMKYTLLLGFHMPGQCTGRAVTKVFHLFLVDSILLSGLFFTLI
jgi:hypothetical protein